MSEYRAIYENIVSAFREYFMECGMPKNDFPLTEVIPKNKRTSADSLRRGITQTALTLILRFNLCTSEERPMIIDKLAELIRDFDNRMSTGFIGTPHILHALSENGRSDIAYNLLFNEENPSWLYSVNHGATTMWEHWNGIKEDGSFWSDDMNSFNHYAYGAVGDWLYIACAGIIVIDAGFKRVKLAPIPDKRLGFVNCSIDTVQGRLESNWRYNGEEIIFEFNLPEQVVVDIALPNGYTERVVGGKHIYKC